MLQILFSSRVQILIIIFLKTLNQAEEALAGPPQEPSIERNCCLSSEKLNGQMRWIPSPGSANSNRSRFNSSRFNSLNLVPWLTCPVDISGGGDSPQNSNCSRNSCSPPPLLMNLPSRFRFSIEFTCSMNGNDNNNLCII